MSPPAPTPVVWTNPVFTPIATAMPTPVSTARTVTPCPKDGRVVFPSISLLDHAVTVTCPSIICNPICGEPCNSTNIFKGALKSINGILFGKKEHKSSADNIIVTPTQALPTFTTLSAPDAVGTHFLFVPGSYPLWSPWVEDPILKWGVINTWAMARLKTWTVLKISGTFDFIDKYCPIVNTFGPFIWYKVFPFIFAHGKHGAWLLWRLISAPLEAFAEMAAEVSNWPEYVAGITKYVNTLVSALTFRELLDIASLLALVCLWKISQRWWNVLHEENTMLRLQMERGAQWANQQFAVLRQDAVEQRHVSVAWFNHLSTENARLNRDLQDVVESAYEEFSALREAAAELRRASVNWFNHLSAENLMRQQELQRDVQFAQQEFNNIWTAGEEHQDAILWLGARADRMEEVVAVIMAEQAVAKDRVDKAESWVDAHNSMILQLHKDAASRFEGVQGEFDALRNDQHVTQERVHVLEKQIDLSRKYMMHLEQETASNFRFVLGRIFEVSTAVEANDADIRVQADVVNSLGGRVSDLETHTEATESSIWCIREDVTGVMEQIDDACKLIGNVQEQCDASTKRIGNIDKQAHTSDNLVTDILKLVNESFREAQQVQTQVKGVTERLLAMQATMDEFKEWITYANDKFQRVYQEVGKVSMALGSMKVCSTLHKDHLIQLYDKVYPELAKTLIESYSYLKRQSGNVIKAEVVFSKTLQDALIRVISEKYTSALVQSGDIKEQLATLQGQVAGLQESARVGAAGAQDALGDRLEERLPESLEQELMPAPLRIQKKQPAAKSLQDMYTDVSGGASSAEALTDKLLAELEAA